MTEKVQMASKRLMVEIWIWRTLPLKAQNEVRDTFSGPREDVSLLRRDRNLVLGS